jgi:putative ABC transport system permease protein
LQETNSIVLTDKLAKKLFGNEDAMGKLIKIDEKENYTVTGILKDLPFNTRFKFEYLLPWAIRAKNNNDDPNWGNNSTRNYVLLKKNASLASIAPKLKS